MAGWEQGAPARIVTGPSLHSRTCIAAPKIAARHRLAQLSGKLRDKCVAKHFGFGRRRGTRKGWSVTLARIAVKREIGTLTRPPRRCPSPTGSYTSVARGNSSDVRTCAPIHPPHWGNVVRWTANRISRPGPIVAQKHGLPP